MSPGRFLRQNEQKRFDKNKNAGIAKGCVAYIFSLMFYSQGDEFMVTCTYDSSDRDSLTFVSF